MGLMIMKRFYEWWGAWTFEEVGFNVSGVIFKFDIITVSLIQEKLNNNTFWGFIL